MSNTSLLGSFGGQAGDALMFRNRIINGDMRIDQRRNGLTAASGADYSLDRWAGSSSENTKISVQQNAGAGSSPAGFSHYLGVTSTSAYAITASDYFAIFQTIEGFNIADFAWGTADAKPVTLSFWVRSSLNGVFGGVLKNASTGATRSYPFTFTISSVNTWEYKTLTVAGDTAGTWNSTNGAGLCVQFSLGVGSTFAGPAGAWAGTNYLGATGAVSLVGTNGATFRVTGVQLEAGPTATPFERRPYSVELGMAMRYYEKVFIGGIPCTYIAGGYSNYFGSASFAVVKRVSPTYIAATSSPAVGNYQPGGGTGTATNTWTSTTGFSFASGLAYNASFPTTWINTAETFLGFSAEL